MKNNSIDVIVALLLSILEGFFIFLDIHGIIRPMIGLIYLIFIPGYLLLRFLFQKTEYLRLLILSIPVSLAIDTIMGMVSDSLFPNLNQTHCMYLIIEFFLIVILIVGYYGQRRLTRINNGIYSIFILFLGILGIVFSLQNRDVSQTSDTSSLYFQGIGDEDLPLEVLVNSPVTIRVGVDLGDEVPVPVQLFCSDSVSPEIITEHGTTSLFERHFSWSIPGAYQVECQLFEQSSEQPIRRIKLEVIVIGS